MLTPYQRRQLQRLRWTAFIVLGPAFVLSFFHRFAPAAIASDLKAPFARMRLCLAHYREGTAVLPGSAVAGGLIDCHLKEARSPDLPDQA